MPPKKKSRQHNCKEIFRVKLKFENDVDVSLTEIEFESLILSSLASLHGQAGAAICFTIRNYENGSASIILEDGKNRVKFWSALTLCGYYQNKRCAFYTQCVSDTG